MKRLWWIILLLFSLLPQPVQAYYGAGQVLCTPIGYFIPITFDGDSSGFGKARDLCIRRGGGSILVGPGMEGVTLTYPKNSNITVIRNFKNGWSADPFNISGVQQGGGYIIAYADSLFTTRSDFPGCGSGIQSALDWVHSKGGGKVVLGPGVFPDSQAIGISSNVWLQGSGVGLTTIKRVIWNPSLTTDYGHGIISIRNSGYIPNKAISGGLPADSLINITVTDLTVDGNFRSWPTENPNTQGAFGIQFWFTDKARIENVEVKNTGQTGIELDACRNSIIKSVYTLDTGLEQMLGTRNGININNNSVLNTTYNWGKRIIVTDCIIINQIDAAIDCANVSDVEISKIQMYCDHDSLYGNMCFEFEGSIAGYIMKNFSISDIIAKGFTGRFFQKGGTIPLDGLKISNVDFTASAASNRGAIVLTGSSSVGSSNVDISNCTFRGLNSSNSDGTVTTATFFQLYNSPAGYLSKHIRLNGITFEGGAGGTAHSINHGMMVGGNVYDFKASNITLKNVEDIGVEVVSNGSDTTRELYFSNISVEGAQKEGFKIFQNGVTGNVIGVTFENCLAKDTNKSGAGPAFFLDGNGGVVKSVKWKGNRIVRTSGTNMQGIKISQGGSGVVDSVWIIDNDFDGANSGAAPIINIVGTVTNYYVQDLTDGPTIANNKFISWKHFSTNVYNPIMKVDSVGALKIYAPPGNNIDFIKNDGTGTIRYYGPDGNLNLYNGSKFMLGGYHYLYDQGFDRRIIQKGNSSTSGIVIRDSADTVDEVRFKPGGKAWFKGAVTVGDSLSVGGGQPIAKIFRGSATLDFDLSALTLQDLTITVTGAALNDEVIIGCPNGAVGTSVVFFGWVSATNTVSIRGFRIGVGVDPPSGTFNVTVIH